ncbi:MAG: hypothetical protein QM817_14945 [Archangium sp.]
MDAGLDDGGVDDGGVDDAGLDGGVDAGLDAGVEAGLDAGFDAGPPWNASLTAFTATKQEVFGFGCAPPSTWSVDLSSREFSYSACVYFRNIVTGSRSLTTNEVGRLRGELEDVFMSNRAFCGTDAPVLRVYFRSDDGGTAASWANDFSACNTQAGTTVVGGLERVFDLLTVFAKAPDAGGPEGPAWPANAQRVVVTRGAQPGACRRADGGLTVDSTWSLDLDSGAVDFEICEPQQNLYVVDSGVLTAAQLDAFNTAANAMVFVPEPIPPCASRGAFDVFRVTTATGTLSFEQAADHCPLPLDVFVVDGGSAARAVLEAATHP